MGFQIQSIVWMARIHKELAPGDIVMTFYIIRLSDKTRTFRSYLVAPRPSFVRLMIAVRGWSSPPVNPIQPPSDQPIMDNKRNPTLASLILGAAYMYMDGLA